MKLLCISDQIDTLVYSNLAKERFSDCDGVLCAGDLPSEYIDFVVSTLNKPTYFIFGNHNLTEYGYYHKTKPYHKGAHPQIAETHSEYDMKGSFGATYIGFKCIRDKHLLVTDSKTNKKRPILIAGVSGCKRYNKGLNQYTEFQMYLNILKIIPKLFYNKIRYGKFLDIFLSHASPRHIHDKEDPCHQGFECFNWFIKHFKPTYFIHGHIHLYDMNTKRVTKTHETTVINAFSHYILNTEEREK